MLQALIAMRTCVSPGSCTSRSTSSAAPAVLTIAILVFTIPVLMEQVLFLRAEKPVLPGYLSQLIGNYENLSRTSGNIMLLAPVALQASPYDQIILTCHGAILPDDDGEGWQFIQKARCVDASQRDSNAVQAPRARTAVNQGDARNIGKRA